MLAREATSATHGGRDAITRTRSDDWRFRILGEEEEWSGAHMVDYSTPKQIQISRFEAPAPSAS